VSCTVLEGTDIFYNLLLCAERSCSSTAVLAFHGIEPPRYSQASPISLQLWHLWHLCQKLILWKVCLGLIFFAISGYRRDVPTFRDDLSTPSSRVKKSKKEGVGPIFKGQEGQEESLSLWPSWPSKMGPIGCPETSVQKYHSALRIIPEECRSQIFNRLEVCVLIFELRHM
jgi:hypothetical protein